MKLFNWKQEKNGRRDEKGENTVNNTYSPFKYKFGLRDYGVMGLMLLQAGPVYGTGSYVHGQNQANAQAYDLMQKLKPLGIIATIVFNKATNAYETQFKIPGAMAQSGEQGSGILDLVKWVATGIYNMPGSYYKSMYHGDPETVSLTTAIGTTGLTFWALGKFFPNKFVVSGDGDITAIYKGALDKAQVNTVLDRLKTRAGIDEKDKKGVANYDALKADITQAKTNERIEKLKEKATQIKSSPDNMFTADNFKKIKDISEDKLKAIVDSKLELIKQQMLYADGALDGVAFDLNADKIIEGAMASRDATALAKALNRYVQLAIDNFVNTQATKAIGSAVSAEIKWGIIVADAEGLTKSFNKYFNEWVNNQRLQKGQKAVLEGDALAEVTGKALWDHVRKLPPKERGKLTTSEDFVNIMKEELAGDLAIEFTQPKGLRALVNRLVGRTGSRVVAGIMVGGFVYLLTDYIMTPKAPSGGGSVNLQNPPQPEGKGTVQKTTGTQYVDPHPGSRPDFKTPANIYLGKEPTDEYIMYCKKDIAKPISKQTVSTYNATLVRAEENETTSFGVIPKTPVYAAADLKGLPMVAIMGDGTVVYSYGDNTPALTSDNQTLVVPKGHAISVSILIDRQKRTADLMIEDAQDSKNNAHIPGLPLGNSWSLANQRGYLFQEQLLCKKELK